MNIRNETETRIKTMVIPIACAVGGMAIVIGEVDDSPGLGGIGILTILLGMWLNYKLVKDKR